MNQSLFLKLTAGALFLGLFLGCGNDEVTAPSQEMIDGLQQEADPTAKEPKMESPSSNVPDPGLPPKS